MENWKFTQCGWPRLLDLNQFPTCIIYNYPKRKFTEISNYLQFLCAAGRWSVSECVSVCMSTFMFAYTLTRVRVLYAYIEKVEPPDAKITDRML